MGLKRLCGGEGRAPSGVPPAPSGDEGRANCTHPCEQGAAGAYGGLTTRGRPVPAGAGRDSLRVAYRSPGVWRGRMA